MDYRTEPISGRIVSAVAILFNMLELLVSSKTAIENSQCDFSHEVICNFSAIVPKFAIAWQALKGCSIMVAPCTTRARQDQGLTLNLYKALAPATNHPKLLRKMLFLF